MADARTDDASYAAADLDALSTFATQRGEIARLHHVAQGAAGRLDRVAEATRDAAARAATLSAWQATLTTEVWQRLHGVGIAARTLKGAALAAWLHGDARIRNSCDIDVLVPTAQIPAALDVLATDGWCLPFRLHVKHFRAPLLGQYREVPLSNFGGTFHLDLHWRLRNPWNDAIIDEQTVLDTAPAALSETVLVNGHSLPWFAPGVLWQLALAHVVSSDWRGLRAWLDLALISDRLSAAHWDEIGRTMTSPHAAGFRAAAAVASHVLGDVFSRRIATLQEIPPTLPATTQRRVARVARRASSCLLADTPYASGWHLLTDCAVAARGSARWRAVTHRMLIPALDDRVNHQGLWRGPLAAAGAMLHRRWKTYGQ